MSNAAPWGATSTDWALFADVLGLKADLLPVVSRPGATIAKSSSLSTIGKTPSTFNNAGEVVGIPRWTERLASDNDLKRWISNSDLGICVQTRLCRAIDIDIEDVAVAQRVRDVVELTLDRVLPRRWRGDSGKCLLAFKMPGAFAKRVIRTAHGIVEFLGNGQQAIVAGTHPKGARYVWEWPNPDDADIPYLTADQFEEVWREITERFAVESATRSHALGQRPADERRVSDVNDPAVQHIETHGLLKSWTRDGRMNIRCPWESEHTSESGETATQWFPAGLGGIHKGNFHCMHAHCVGRTREQFFEAIGYEEDVAVSFEVVQAAPGVVEAPKPVFQRKRNGAILGNVWNVRLALRRPDVSLRHIAFDEFRAEVVLAWWAEGQTEHSLLWRPFTDNDYTRLKLHLEGPCGFETVSKENLRDVVHEVAEGHKFDSAIEWLTYRVPAWDGKPRIEQFFSRYLGAVDSAYTRAVGIYIWTAMAGRVLEPGCKADMVPVLISEEGTGKSSAAELMVPSADHYVEIDLNRRDDDLSRAMRGKLLGELAELRGLQTRDEESIKAWVTRKYEEWTPKYREFAIKFLRRLVFIGTANNGEFLPNDGGAARRWLPLVVGATKFAELAADRDQLWAEARELFAAGGVAWRAANELGRKVRDDHRVVDDWQGAIVSWLQLGELDDPDGMPRGARPVTTAEVLSGAIGLPIKGVARKEQERAARVLRALGYIRKKARVHGAVQWAYVPTTNCDFLRVANVLDLA